MNRVITAVTGAVAVAACAVGLLALGPDEDTAATAPAGGRRAGPAAGPQNDADRTADAAVRAAYKKTRRSPDDPLAWSGLAQAEIEQARVTLDADRLEAAEKALRRSKSLKSTDNYAAVTGSGLLANARHEFGQARSHGEHATRMAPDRPDGYAVLADADIQLGDYPAARTAVQRLLDLAPASAAYTRAAYDLETHGRNADAAVALRRAEQSGETPGEISFAASRLGELAWSAGRLGTAQGHFERALRESPRQPYALSGLARVQAAQGHTGTALRTYGRLTDRVPAPQFLREHLDLRIAAGKRRDPETRAVRSALDVQVRLLRAEGGPVDPHLALYEADHGDPDTAVELMRREAEKSRSVIVADALGWALHRAGQDDEALDWVRKAARTGWKSPMFRCHRGAVEKALGMPEGDRHLAEGRALNRYDSACRSSGGATSGTASGTGDGPQRRHPQEEEGTP